MTRRNKSGSHCFRCTQFNRQYIDLATGADAKLSMVAQLLDCASPNGDPHANLLHEIGHSISEYLVKKRVIDHIFFGRTITSYQLSESDLRAEFLRVQMHIKADGL